MHSIEPKMKFSVPQAVPVIVALLLVAGCASPDPPASKAQSDKELTLLTLNIAHGRKDGRNQMLQRTATIRRNLDDITRLLAQTSPDLVALEEADGPSFWSGKFDHVKYLATQAKFPHHARGSHVEKIRIEYGTALLSKHPLAKIKSVKFPPSPPTFTKGFVLAEVSLPPAKAGGRAAVITVVSVHLDFSRGSVREKQIRHLVQHLKTPLIIMGDFNCQWPRKDGPLKTLAHELNLHAYRPESKSLKTYPLLKTRLDWIFISRELRFGKYQVLPDRVSDHHPVRATILLK